MAADVQLRMIGGADLDCPLPRRLRECRSFEDVVVMIRHETWPNSSLLEQFGTMRDIVAIIFAKAWKNRRWRKDGRLESEKEALRDVLRSLFLLRASQHPSRSLETKLTANVREAVGGLRSQAGQHVAGLLIVLYDFHELPMEGGAE